MGDVINLRRVRKTRSRKFDAEQAAENRANYGLPRAARALIRAEVEQRSRRLDGHNLGAGGFLPDVLETIPNDAASERN